MRSQPTSIFFRPALSWSLVRCILSSHSTARRIQGIPGAVNMMPDELDEAVSASTLEQGVPYLLYTNEGYEVHIRGRAFKLAKAGLTTYVLNADLSGWVDAGYLLEKVSGQARSSAPASRHWT